MAIEMPEMEDEMEDDMEETPSGKQVDLVTEFIRMREQYQVFHWQTTSFAAHKAFDWIFDELSCNIDKFMEVFIGINGRGGISGPFKVILLDSGDADPVEFTNHCLGVVEDICDMIEGNDDLENICADMTGALNKLKYLLTLS